LLLTAISTLVYELKNFALTWSAERRQHTRIHGGQHLVQLLVVSSNVMPILESNDRLELDHAPAGRNVALDKRTHLKVALGRSSGHMFWMARSAMHQLGVHVRAARKRTSLSQAAFADKCGIDRLYLGRIELGKQNPTVAILLRIALEADTDAASLLSGIVVDPDEIRALSRPMRRSR
jgi:DNA-binding XRE family transcriptional regulator